MPLTIDEFVDANNEAMRRVLNNNCMLCLDDSCPCLGCPNDCDECALFKHDDYGCFDERFWTCPGFLSITTA
jgi:hypothetical protein